MKLEKLVGLSLVLSLGLMTSCKEPPEKSVAEEQTEIALEQEQTPSESAVDPSKDPLVIGKEFSKVLADTLNIQMYEMLMNPGDSVGLHQHLDHTIYVLEGGKLLLYIDGTEAMEMQLNTGDGFFSGPLSDAAKNIGDTPIRMVITEIHRSR